MTTPGKASGARGTPAYSRDNNSSQLWLRPSAEPCRRPGTRAAQCNTGVLGMREICVSQTAAPGCSRTAAEPRHSRESQTPQTERPRAPRAERPRTFPLWHIRGRPRLSPPAARIAEHDGCPGPAAGTRTTPQSPPPAAPAPPRGLRQLPAPAASPGERGHLAAPSHDRARLPPAAPAPPSERETPEGERGPAGKAPQRAHNCTSC